MGNMTSFVWKGRRTILVAVHNEHQPSDEEWGRYMQKAEQIVRSSPNLEFVRGLAITEGGAPGHMQRANLNRLLGGRAVTSAVVTASKVVRAVIHVLSFFNSGVKGFASDKLPDALDYLGLPKNDRSSLFREIESARAQLTHDALRAPLGGAVISINQH